MNDMTSINQQTNNSSDMGLLTVARSVGQSIRQLLGIKLAGIGVLVGQDHLLDQLRPDEPLEMYRLAGMLGVMPSTISKMVDQLVLKGWVAREGSLRDKRLTLVRLLPAGEAVRNDVRRIWDEVERELSDDLGVDAAQEEVLSAIRNLARLLAGQLHRLR